MRAVLQRVNRAAVRVDGETVGEITRPGLLALVGATHDDGPEQVATSARMIAVLRIFEGPGDSGGARGRVASASDLGAPVLVVSQFTLYADVRKGRRPSWNAAAPGPVAAPLVDAVARALRRRGIEVATGRFGAHMLIDMEADGPVTFVVEACGASAPGRRRERRRGAERRRAHPGAIGGPGGPAGTTRAQSAVRKGGWCISLAPRPRTARSKNGGMTPFSGWPSPPGAPKSMRRPPF